MDEIKYSEYMRELRERTRFSSIEQALYYELVAIWRNKGYPVEFFCSNKALCYNLDITEKTLIRSRGILKKNELINYFSGISRNRLGNYSILPIPVVTPVVAPVVAPVVETAFQATSNNVFREADAKEKLISKVFYPPTLEEVNSYCMERENGIDPQLFIDFYTSKEWMIGKNKMKDWKAAIRTWELTRKKNENNSDNTKPKDYNKRF